MMLMLCAIDILSLDRAALLNDHSFASSSMMVDGGANKWSSNSAARFTDSANL